MTRLTRRHRFAPLAPKRGRPPVFFANVIGITSESDFSSQYNIGLHVQVTDRQSQLADDRILRMRAFYADAFCSLPLLMSMSILMVAINARLQRFKKMTKLPNPLDCEFCASPGPEKIPFDNAQTIKAFEVIRVKTINCGQ